MEEYKEGDKEEDNEGDDGRRKRLKYMEGLVLAAQCGAVDILGQAGDHVGFRGMVASISL